MEASTVYKCLSDPERLRILNLLEEGPLCVCHLQEILGTTQVKMSKQLATMKRAGFVTATREGTWMIYRLKSPVSPLLLANLRHLREADCDECNRLQHDLIRRFKVLDQLVTKDESCPDCVCETLNT